jgi:hypothetical protein
VLQKSLVVYGDEFFQIIPRALHLGKLRCAVSVGTTMVPACHHLGYFGRYEDTTRILSSQAGLCR